MYACAMLIVRKRHTVCIVYIIWLSKSQIKENRLYNNYWQSECDVNLLQLESIVCVLDMNRTVCNAYICAIIQCVCVCVCVCVYMCECVSVRVCVCMCVLDMNRTVCNELQCAIIQCVCGYIIVCLCVIVLCEFSVCAV